MKKLFFISFVAISIMFTGCFTKEKSNTSNNSSDLSSQQNSTKVSEVKGVAYDGILYDAKVEIYDSNGNLIASGVTSSNPSDLGSFSIKVENLPTNYYIKIVGGVDTGSDDIKNDNDYNSTLILQSVGKENNFTAITPATTLVVNLVKKGYSVNEAKKVVNNSLGLPSNIDITSLNPKKDLTAKKAAKAVVLLATVLPGDTNKNLNTLTNIITKEKIANINSAEPIEINISKIVAVKENNNSVVQKYEQYSEVIQNQLNEALNAYNTNNQINIETSVNTIEVIKNTIEDNKPYSVKDVNVFKQKLKTVLEILKSENITYNINEVKDIIQNNLDLNTTQIVDKIKSFNKIADISDENRKILYKALIDENSSIDLEKLNSIDLSNLNIENASLNEKRLYYQLIAVIIADNIDYYINNDFIDIQNYIIQNYYIKNSIDFILNIKNKNIKEIIFEILKNYFYKKQLNENTFNEINYNNLTSATQKIENYLISLKNAKDITIFKVLIKYIDINNFDNDYNSRILPLYEMIKNVFLQQNIAFVATLNNFEQTYKDRLLNKKFITIDDINKVVININEQNNIIEPIMFPMIVNL